MRRSLQIFFIASCCTLLSATHSFSQTDPYWNGWIKFSQKYYKIPVSQNGIYRLDYQTLSNAGVPVSSPSFDPREIQLFFRGQEQHIYVEGEADGVFNTSDYIEFYGQKNDGVLDTILYKGDLYKDPIRQPNPYYSLFNDTSAYFLTWNNLTTNKRIILSADTDFASAPVPTDYFLKEDVVEYHTHYYYGFATQYNINFPEYQQAEGWAGLNFYQNTSNITSFNTSNIYSGTGAPDASVKLAVMGASNDLNDPDHDLQIRYKDNAGVYVSLDHQIFDGYLLFASSYPIPASKLGASTDIIVSALSGSFSTSRNAVPYVVLKYPHNLNLENKNYFELFVSDNPSQPKSNYTFTNFSSLPSTPVYIYDLTNNLKILTAKSGSTYKALVPNSINSTEKFCIVKSEAQFLNVQSITPVRGTGLFTDYSALNVDSAFLIITHKSLMTGAAAYQNYRASSAGGSHNVLVVDIEDLYDQFGYGISKNPLSIRHFADYCLDKFPTPPQNLFLLGKGVQTNLARNQYTDPAGDNYANSLVPSIGYPTCDNLLVTVLNGNLLAPAIPIGRLAAKSNAEVMTYLNKVYEYEQVSPNPEEWMKHVIHMGGGSTAPQQTQFSNYLHGYEKTIEDTSFGGFVHHFSKNSSSPTQVSYTDSIRGLINKGVSIITFFGHTSASVFEFNLLPPNKYENKNGKYPFFIADGCVAGDIHQPTKSGISSSEIYTLSDQGVIAFLASSGPGTANELDKFTSRLYKDLGQDLYGRSIGKCIQATIDSVEGSATDPYMNAACLEMTLHGDPSIVIHSGAKPDYAVSNASVYFTPAYVSSDLDSFDVNVIVANIGKATKDSVRVNIKRTFVDGTYTTYAGTIPRVYYKDTLTFTLPVDPVHGPGLNKFEVMVDSADRVDELENILNNNITAPYEVPLLIYSGDIIPIYPYKYAIVPDDTITLKAYLVNPFADSAQYIFEIDTTDLFNSPLHYKKQLVTQKGAVVKAPFNLWSPSPLVLSDSLVYFWRVRKNDPDTLTYRWRESSFQYIPDKRGWGQSHFFQFLKGDKFSYIDTNRVPRYFDLDYQNTSIIVQTLNVNVWGTGHYSEVYFQLDALNQYLASSISYTIPHVIVCVIDPATGELWHNDGTGPYGSLVTGNPSKPGDEGFEFYTSTPAQQESLRTFLQDTVPCGSKVILYTSGDHNLGDVLGGNGPTTNPGLVQAFQSIGGTQFPNIQNNMPYIIVGRKCGTAMEEVGTNDSSKVLVIDTVSIKRESGTIFSEIIGPASKWKSLHWKYTSPEDISNPILAAKDTILITVVGIQKSGAADTLIKNIDKNLLDIYNLDTAISATTYPYLQLIAWVKDSILRTPAQLKYWRVYYDGVPDASLNPVKHYAFYNPAVQQGDSMSMSVAIENIGDYDMDSMWVKFWVYDANRNIVPLDSIKIDSLLIDSIQIPDVKFSTENLPGGLSSLWVEANPFNSQHQLEQYHYNNIGTIPFTIGVDNINPLLDVTFDGVHIMNGDLVSAKPLVTVRLKDENTFLALNDTSDFEVYLKHPSKNTYDRIYFGNGTEMTFDSAVLPNNSCRINYTPALADGKYELKVQASDRSGNASGNVEYKITFEVVNKPTITNVLNYPNPFSTSTKFVFTLTGTEVPDFFKIQILTVTGKIVRDINKYELGPIHIGRNITEYAWDGKDEFGDQLANGLYIYRVITQLNGKSLEHRETEADSFFTQGFGKMYLIR